MQNLQTLISQIEKGREIHISILDLNGILDTPLTKISFKNVIHSKAFCDMAKSTPKGYGRCIECKNKANKKAKTEKAPFCGHCSYGLYELAYPVIQSGNVVAIIYVGNAVIDEQISKSIIERASKKTGVDKNLLFSELNNAEKIESEKELYEIAEIVSDYMKMLCDIAPKNKNNIHWLVSLIKEHIDENYSEDLSLKEIANTYQKNEKYLGRLFKEQMGISFSSYYNSVRLKKAEGLLQNSSLKVLDIALECGFNNVSYFNRLFYKKHSILPKEYRKANDRIIK